MFHGSTLKATARAAALALALPLSATAAEPRQTAGADARLVTLFNGTDFSGWHGQETADPRKFAALSDEDKAKQLARDAEDLKQHWKVENGELVNDGHGVYLTTDKDYGDVELYVDFKILPKGDSGLYLRATPQIQIWDFTEPSYAKMGADKGSGGLWNNNAGSPGKDPLVVADNPIGDWNTLRVIQVGSRTTVYLNGKLVVNNAIWENYWDRNLPIAAKGPIQLQTHGSEVRWRNIKVREIPADEANAILAGHGAEGFTSIFNGKDFEGWGGPTENYVVANGVLTCKPEKGGTIYYNKELTDFSARLQFRLPPGGNNGLAIRYPGEGDTAYHGMCELQIIDDTSDKYGKLDPRQQHGSAYGMVASTVGYLRPVGEWNFQEVTVKGSKIKVELNGTVILNTALSTVKEFMANSPHPGKDRASGFFGFAGHNDPVEFREIAIKPITATEETGWVPLFDGKTLEGWTRNGGTAAYRVEDGTIVGTTVDGSPNTFLCKGEFQDFILEADVKCDPRLNSGFQVRSHVYAEDGPDPLDPNKRRSKGVVYGPQCEIADKATGTAGRFYDESRRDQWICELSDAAKSAFNDNEWNHYKIVVQGNHYRSWINGVPCSDFTDDKDNKGLIGLQVHGIARGEGPFEVRWKNVRIKELANGETIVD